MIHLIRRWWRSLPPTPPAVHDEVWAESVLLPGELSLWRQLTNADRRHAIEVASRFSAAAGDAPRAALAGALLHDVGKLPSSLGTTGRVLATVAGPRSDRFRRYHQHEALGAEMLAAVGSDPATVELVAGTGPWRAALEVADQI